jgi:hypothetical protein
VNPCMPEIEQLLSVAQEAPYGEATESMVAASPWIVIQDGLTRAGRLMHAVPIRGSMLQSAFEGRLG